MHWLIDTLALIVLIFFLLAGWKKGFLLSFLGIIRIILAYGLSLLAGRYLGFWLGSIANRPRIITIPVVAGLTFVIIVFIFHVLMTNIRDDHRDKEERENFSRPKFSCFSGSVINLFAGLISLIVLFWMGDILTVAFTEQPLPGAEQSYFGSFARRSVYEVSNVIISRKGKESQAAAMAHVISNPAQGMDHLKGVFEADSIQQLISNKTFAQDIMSGDANRIEQNATLQQLFNDKQTLKNLKQLGILPSRISKTNLCENLAQLGNNETIQASLENLKAKELFSTDKVLLLVRDPDFDVIIGELLK